MRTLRCNIQLVFGPVLFAIAISNIAQANDLTIFTDRAAWEAALGNVDIRTDNFNGYTSGGLGTPEDADLLLFDFTGDAVGPNTSFISTDPWPGPDGTQQLIGRLTNNGAEGRATFNRFDFASPIKGFGGHWRSMTTGQLVQMEVNGTLIDFEFDVPGFQNPGDGFAGFIDSHPITSATFSAVNVGDPNAEDWGVDDFSIAGNDLVIDYTLPTLEVGENHNVKASSQNLDMGPGPKVPGLGQTWYESKYNHVDEFKDATPVNSVPFQNNPYTWFSGQDGAQRLAEVVGFPDHPSIASIVSRVSAQNNEPMSVKFTGEIKLDNNTEYLIRDSINQYHHLQIDLDDNGRFDPDELIVEDSEWTNFYGDGNGGGTETLFETFGSDDEWRNIELVVGGSGWNMVLWLTKAESPDVDNWPDIFEASPPGEGGTGVGGFSSIPLQEEYILGNDILRSDSVVVVGGEMEANLVDSNVIFNVEVDGNLLRSSLIGLDTAGIDSLEGSDLVTTKLNLAGATVRVSQVGEIFAGDEFVLFDADVLEGEGELELIFDDPSQWDITGLSNDGPGGHRIEYIGAGPGLDCNGDGQVNAADFACSNLAGTTGALQTELNVLPGDFDGVDGVAFPDFLVLAANFGDPNANAYNQGDIDGVGGVAFSDFLSLAANFGLSSTTPAAVPEPSSLALLGLGGLLLGLVRRRRSS